MEITNDTDQPIVVEAQRGGGGERNPPWRTEVDPSNRVRYEEAGGGAIYLEPGQPMAFEMIEDGDYNMRAYDGNLGSSRWLASKPNAVKGQPFRVSRPPVVFEPR
jgi:hypothetical protein